jgi:hypothetical protein
VPEPAWSPAAWPAERRDSRSPLRRTRQRGPVNWGPADVGLTGPRVWKARVGRVASFGCQWRLVVSRCGGAGSAGRTLVVGTAGAELGWGRQLNGRAAVDGNRLTPPGPLRLPETIRILRQYLAPVRSGTSTAAVSSRFGTWNAALVAAALPAKPSVCSDEDVIDALRADVCRLAGHRRLTSWPARAPAVPGIGAVITHFGSCNAGLRAAGLTVTREHCVVATTGPSAERGTSARDSA